MLKLGKMTVFTMILVLILAACGGGTASNTGGAATSSPDSKAAAPTPEAKSVTVEHAKGTETFTKTPQKIVALEWTLAEDLLALGIQPAGVADIKGYTNWVKAGPKLSADVVDVGTRQEPNLEAIAALKPDLILTVDFRAAKSYDQLKGIAPTIVFGSEFEENLKSPYTYMVNTFNTIASITGKTQEADQVLAQLKKTIADNKEKLKASGKAGSPFVITQAWSNQNAAVMRLFTDNSMAVELLKEIGMNNAFQPSKYQPNGFETVSVEALAKVQDANFFYVVQENDNVFQNQLKDNAVWNGLNFVKENRTYSLGGDTWFFGGPLSAELIVTKVVGQLVK